MVDRYAEIKADIICKGVNLENLNWARSGGAGSAGGKCFTFPDKSSVNVPVLGSYIKSSPYKLIKINGTKYILSKNGKEVSEMYEVPVPSFYEKFTSDGIPMWKIALFHGSNCLASTVIQNCYYWRVNKPCKFCAIESSLKTGRTIAVKKPEQLAEVAKESIRDGVQQITLTTGTTASPDKGALILSKAVSYIKNVVELPIHVQVEPPSDLIYLDKLHSSGVDTIGIHVETLDPNVSQDLCPMKPRLEDYQRNWDRAVKLFGENQVSSYVIIGVGEDRETTLRGLKQMSLKGVIPYIVPMRPIPTTKLENSPPPEAEYLISITEYVCNIMKEIGLNPFKTSAGCVRCGSCSLIKEVFKGS